MQNGCRVSDKRTNHLSDYQDSFKYLFSKTMKTKNENNGKKPVQTREQKILEASRKSSRTFSSAKAFLMSAGIITEDGELSPIYK